MPQPANRMPRAPRLTTDLARPETAEHVFVDDAVHDGMRLEDVRLADLEADSVELKRFVRRCSRPP